MSWEFNVILEIALETTDTMGCRGWIFAARFSSATVERVSSAVVDVHGSGYHGAAIEQLWIVMALS